MRKYYLILIVYAIIALISCEDEENIVQPTLATTTISEITSDSALSGGSISSNGGGAITGRGVCWSKTANPTINDNFTTDGTGEGTFVSNIEDLEDSTTYYIRAYATNEKGTSYGNELTFTTLSGLPKLTTSEVTDVAQFTANSGGNIFYTGGLSITGRGVCWSKTANPTIDDNFTTDGTGEGTFVSNISGLNENTTYYLRAYATNDKGTSYGSEVSFKTLPDRPLVSTVEINNIAEFSANCYVEIESEGISPVTEKGVCWSTNQNPTINDNLIIEGSGIDNFTSNLENLDANKNYFIRSFATNNEGTRYGNELTFKTLPVTDIDGNEYSTIKIGDQVWLVENLNVTKYQNGDPISNETNLEQWASLNTGAYCNYDFITSNGDIYGKLYNWYAVNDSRKIAPEGWHVATNEDWNVLINFLGGNSIAGGKLKEEGTSHWESPNTGATNIVGFTALPGGCLESQVGTWCMDGFNGGWWTNTDFNAENAWYIFLEYDSESVKNFYYNKKNGYSVRCVKD